MIDLPLSCSSHLLHIKLSEVSWWHSRQFFGQPVRWYDREYKSAPPWTSINSKLYLLTHSVPSTDWVYDGDVHSRQAVCTPLLSNWHLVQLEEQAEKKLLEMATPESQYIRWLIKDWFSHLSIQIHQNQCQIRLDIEYIALYSPHHQLYHHKLGTGHQQLNKLQDWRIVHYAGGPGQRIASLPDQWPTCACWPGIIQPHSSSTWQTLSLTIIVSIHTLGTAIWTACLRECLEVNTTEKGILLLAELTNAVFLVLPQTIAWLTSWAFDNIVVVRVNTTRALWWTLCTQWRKYLPKNWM